MKIGVLSDTANHLDPKIPELFAGVDHILHGGDIGQPWIILQLEMIAPVTAVLGNNDTSQNFKETEVVTLGGRKFLVHHIVDVRKPAELLQRRGIIRENSERRGLSATPTSRSTKSSAGRCFSIPVTPRRTAFQRPALRRHPSLRRLLHPRGISHAMKATNICSENPADNDQNFARGP